MSTHETPGFKHEQVKVIHPIFNDILIEIDKKLVSYLVPIWQMGIVTRYSCQGQKWDLSDSKYNRGYIAYDAPDDLLMTVAMNSLFRPETLDWERFDNYEERIGQPRLTGPMWCVRFPPLKDVEES